MISKGRTTLSPRLFQENGNATDRAFTRNSSITLPASEINMVSSLKFDDKSFKCLKEGI